MCRTYTVGEYYVCICACVGVYLGVCVGVYVCACVGVCRYVYRCV